MIKYIDTDEKPSVLKVEVATRRPQKIWVVVADSQRKNTYYTKRYGIVEGRKSFFVNMPQSPEVAKVIVYNDKFGLDNRDNSFRSRVGVKPLKATLPKMNKQTKSFVKFAQEFADECGYLSYSSKGDTYRSNDGQFVIVYFDVIRNSSGQVLETPARISQINGKIEVSAKHFKKYTIPMRLGILFHEYSHFYLNKLPHSEVEADKNGLYLYLGLEYPKIDILNVFLNVFKRSPSRQNKERYDLLENFIETEQE
jgi:hypothetical protein